MEANRTGQTLDPTTLANYEAQLNVVRRGRGELYDMLLTVWRVVGRKRPN